MCREWIGGRLRGDSLASTSGKKKRHKKCFQEGRPRTCEDLPLSQAGEYGVLSKRKVAGSDIAGREAQAQSSEEIRTHCMGNDWRVLLAVDSDPQGYA